MTDNKLPTKQITGYPSQWSVEPKETIEFMVNCGEEKYRADVVQIQCADPNPEGPGVKEEVIETPVNGEYPGQLQEIHAGSHVTISGSAFDLTESFTLQTMIYPTTPNKGLQGLLTKWSQSNETGYGLFIGENGDLLLRLSPEEGDVKEITTGNSFEKDTWYFISATFDAKAGEVTLYQEPRMENQRQTLHPVDDYTATIKEDTSVGNLSKNDVPFVMAGFEKKTELENTAIEGDYNGKIDSPRVASQALDYEEMQTLIDGAPSAEIASSVVAAWDFSEGISSDGIKDYTTAVDASPHNRHGEFVHVPARAVTGYNWTGEEGDFTQAPDQYGAVHFHDDDVGDADWQVDFELTISSEMESAAYSVRLRTDDDEAYIPFFVRPKTGDDTADIAFLAPTATYLAYANDHLMTDGPLSELTAAQASCMREEDIFLSEHREYGAGLYDTHADGSGVMYSSRLRPILNMAPKYKHWLSMVPSSLWGYNADLHLIDWLEEKEYDYDIITDKDIHEEGTELLESFNVVLTGSHPEYHSFGMMDAIEAYTTQQGGRFMYLGGNGFYWSIAYHPENSQIIEVRRGMNGDKAWMSEPGEEYHSFTGEKGGIWRDRGKPTPEVMGVGYIAHGLDKASYYRRQPDSYEPETSFMFKGIGDEELVGDFGLHGGGAAGLEVDRYDSEWGTPTQTHLLASSEDHTSNYMRVPEEIYFNDPGLSGSQDPDIRADITYTKYPNGGGILSTGSMTWCSSLAHDDYENNVSRLTENVLNRFMEEESLP
jgi:N,N-dimethylformamidase